MKFKFEQSSTMSATEKSKSNERPEYDELKEYLKREQREISRPLIEEAKRKRDQLLEARGIFSMSKRDFYTYFSSKDFKVRADLKQQNMEQDNQKTMNDRELAKTFESQIKRVVAEKFSVPLDDLALLLEDKNGVYASQEEPDTLCCFVVGQKNGFLYLVTGRIEDDGKSLTNLTSDIVS